MDPLRNDPRFKKILASPEPATIYSEKAQFDSFYPRPVNGRNSSRTILPFFTV